VKTICSKGRAIASCQLPNPAAWVPFQVRSCGICVGRSGIWALFLRVLRFPPPILIQPTAPHTSLTIIRGWYNRPNSGRRNKWTQSHAIPRTKIKLIVLSKAGKVKVTVSLYRLWRPLGLREVEAPTFSDMRLTDGGKVVSPTRRPLFTPRKFPDTYFC
jgi:hypothetical protein